MSDPLLEAKGFWREAFALQGAASWRVLPALVAVGGFATLIDLLYYYAYPNLSIEVGPHEVGGVLLSLLLVMRTNAGYDRWWEARKLWGGIVNQSRNLALGALAHGPAQERWRTGFLHWLTAFAWTAKARLRGEKQMPELASLVGEKEAVRIQSAEHGPLYVALKIEELLRQACEAKDGMDRVAFMQAQRERALLLDHLGGCERIRTTPLASAYSVAIRQFIFVFLITLPFALLHKFEADWLAPLVTILVAYTVLMLDQLGIELQQPFSLSSLAPLPLDNICQAIQTNLLSLLHVARSSAQSEVDST
jgi:putative membrane protein